MDTRNELKVLLDGHVVDVVLDGALAVEEVNGLLVGELLSENLLDDGQ